MPRYIDAYALYEQTAEWEAQALAIVEKLNSKPLGEMDVNEITEWRKWSCILNERSAFKHDVADAPTADVVERKRGKWIKMSDADGVYWACSECGEDIPRVSHYDPQFDLFPLLESIEKTHFCPNCGADMGGEQDE